MLYQYEEIVIRHGFSGTYSTLLLILTTEHSKARNGDMFPVPKHPVCKFYYLALARVILSRNLANPRTEIRKAHGIGIQFPGAEYLGHAVRDRSRHQRRPRSPRPPVFLSRVLRSLSTLACILSSRSSSNSLSISSRIFINCSSEMPIVLTTTLGAPSRYLKFSIAFISKVCRLSIVLRLSWRFVL